MNLEQILRTAEVRRWHILRLSNEQSVGEHVYCVIHTAIALYEAMGKPSNVDVRNLITIAAYHDKEEGLTGDIPSPTKAAARSVGIDWNMAVHRMVPDVVIPGCPNIDTVEHLRLKSIIKLADLIDAWRFVQFYRVNPHGDVVRDRLHALIFDYADKADFYLDGIKWREAAEAVMKVITGPVKELADESVLRK